MQSPGRACSPCPPASNEGGSGNQKPPQTASGGACDDGDDPSNGPTTWGNQKTLADHFNRHGEDFGSRSAQHYAQQASDFLRASQAQRLPTKIASDGTIRVYDPATNTFGSYTSSGATRTFYKPDPAMHPYNTNIEYWIAQPGSSPWTP